MKHKMKDLDQIRLFTIALLSSLTLGGFLSCGAEPDLSFAPGNCKLTCENAMIGSNDMRIRFLQPEKEFTASCVKSADGAESDYQSEIPIRFVIEKQRASLPTDAKSSSKIGVLSQADQGNIISEEGGGGEEDEGSTGSTTVWEPVAGISFQPTLYGGIAGDQAINPTNDPDPLYKGILTAQEQWCTDSCGTGSLRIKPRCLEIPDGEEAAENPVFLGVLSGNIFNSTSFILKYP